MVLGFLLLVAHVLRKGMCLNLSPKVHDEGRHSQNEMRVHTHTNRNRSSPHSGLPEAGLLVLLLTVRGREVGNHLLANNSIVIVLGEHDQQMVTSELSVVGVGVRNAPTQLFLWLP